MYRVQITNKYIFLDYVNDKLSLNVILTKKVAFTYDNPLIVNIIHRYTRQIILVRVLNFCHKLYVKYQSIFDKLTPYTKVRWTIFISLFLVFCARIVLTQGYYMIAYGLEYISQPVYSIFFVSKS